MKQITRCALLIAAVGFFLIINPFSAGFISIHAQDQNIQTIEVTAKKYEFSPSPIHVKAGTKVQLKITAVDHDHGFKIATVPEGVSDNKPGLVFASPQECFQLKISKQQRLSSWPKHRAPTPFAAVMFAVSATKACTAS